MTTRNGPLGKRYDAAPFSSHPPRAHAITARFSDEELRLMDQAANAMGATRAQFMRQCVADRINKKKA